jgi:hypothetical protein
MTADRSLIARLAAHESWARTTDPGARTEPARRALLDRFEGEVDPDGVLPPDERARRAAHAPQGLLRAPRTAVCPGPTQEVLSRPNSRRLGT